MQVQMYVCISVHVHMHTCLSIYICTHTCKCGYVLLIEKMPVDGSQEFI